MRRAALAFLAALCACAPSPPAPVQVMAVVPTDRGTYEPTPVELTTVSDFVNLKGSVLELLGGNRVVVDSNDPLQRMNGGLVNMTDEQRYEVIVKDKGADVRGNFISREGVYWPADFHTWNMVSTFYNFERSYAYFARISNGVAPTELQGMPVMYWANVRIESPTPLTDNALYLSFIKSFVIVPFETQQMVPLAMNIGVIGHEVAHKSFGFRVLADEGIHPALVQWTGQPFNLLKSIDEGFSDFHGFGVTCGEAAGCRPDFLSVSLDDERMVELRNVARTDACMDANTRNAFLNSTPSQWVASPDMYRVGNLWAAAMYQAGNTSGDVTVMEKALLAAYDDESPASPGLRQLVSGSLNAPYDFTPEAVANVIVQHVSDVSLQTLLCNEFSTRLQLKCGTFPCAEMPACPPTSARQDFCPTLPPLP